MRKKFISTFAPAAVLLVAFGVASCDREDEVVENAAMPAKESAIQKHIADHKKERTRSGELVKLEPVVYGGDTVMYVANYDEGWEIFSNSTTMPMVLMRSETGRFDASSLSGNPAFAAFFDMSKANLSAEMHDASAEAQPGSEEWAAYGVEIKNSPQRAVAPETLVLVGVYDKGSDITKTNHLLKTRWDQIYPYNIYIPLVSGSQVHAATGCGAIAASQYLYYYHFKFGIPETCVTSASYNSTLNRYTFSGSSSAIWNQMPLGDTAYPSEAAAIPAALLIGDVANGIKANFGSSTGNDPKDRIDYVNKRTNQNLSLQNFNSSSVNALISGSSIPVQATLYGDSGNHAVIIDAIDTYRNYAHYYYAPSSALGGRPVEIIYGATLKEMQDLYGPAVTLEKVYTSVTYHYRFNWGYGPNALDPDIDSSLMVNYGNDKYTSIKVAL